MGVAMVGGKGTKVNWLAIDGTHWRYSNHLRQQLQRIVGVSQVGRLENEWVFGEENVLGSERRVLIGRIQSLLLPIYVSVGDLLPLNSWSMWEVAGTYSVASHNRYNCSVCVIVIQWEPKNYGNENKPLRIGSYNYKINSCYYRTPVSILKL